MFSATDLEQARAEGRREANNAITWNTSCLGCADRLDGLYAERVAGARDMAREIDRLLRARGQLFAAGLAREYAGKEGLVFEQERAIDGPESTAEPRSGLLNTAGHQKPSQANSAGSSMGSWRDSAIERWPN